LGLIFSGLKDFKAGFMEEVWACIEFLKISYNDVMSMPTWERRYFMEKKKMSNKETQDTIDAQRASNTGSGQKTTSVSGQQLKNNISKYQ
jgi:hypothetical protein